jgi:membrane protease YdiL (CAAX protease family)
MESIFEWNPDFFSPVVILGTTIFCIIGHWAVIHSSLLERIFVRKFEKERAKITWIFFWRYSGVFFYFIIPVFSSIIILKQDFRDWGLGIKNLTESLIWIAGLGLSIVLVQSFAAANKSNLKQYPQIRISEWSKSLFLKNILLWLIYLVAYEFMFRGFLLFGSVGTLGVWPAILINTALYSVTHIPKGIREAVLAIPFGFFLCYITLRTGTIWVAVFVHFILAASNDYFSIRAHPEMKFN